MRSKVLAALAVVALGLSGCVVRERGYYRGAPPCGGGIFVAGHYGMQGRWHPGHWRCPGGVEILVP